MTGYAAADTITELGRLFAGVLEQGLRIYQGQPGVRPAPAGDGRLPSEPVVITGAALGLPGVERVFDDGNIGRILSGEQFIDAIPRRVRQAMVDKHITRLVKRETGDPTFETIDSERDVIKLAGRNAPLDMVAEFGVEPERDRAFDVSTRLAIGAGFDALRDAGIPLVTHYRTTTLGTRLADRWLLPESMRDDTGVIFASAFPGLDAYTDELTRYYADHARREELAGLEAVRSRMTAGDPAVAEADRRIGELRRLLDTEPYVFDRRFLFKCLSMGHSQFAEIVGARGPNTQVNAACASTTLALALAEDWIRAGRCRRVVVISADDATSDTLLPWIGAGFLASGAAATDAVVEDAATPFDRRRHGMVVGMGAAALVVESAEAARERGLQPICEVLGTVAANSAYHGTRLDVDHIGQVMEKLLRQAEARGVDRRAIAPATVFVSHETYTPARGGSAAAEINALRRAFGDSADSVVITNTKGFTGHAMGAGVEDVVAVKALETGVVPPVPNYKEPDPGAGPAEPVPRWRVPGGVRAAAGRRFRLADRDGTAALAPDRRPPAAGTGRTRIHLPDRRPGGMAVLAGRRGRPARSPARGRAAPVADRRGRRAGCGPGGTCGRGGYGRRDARTLPGGCPLASGRHASPGSRGPGPGDPAGAGRARGGRGGAVTGSRRPCCSGGGRAGGTGARGGFRAAPGCGGAGRCGAGCAVAAPGPAVDAVAEAVVSVVAQTTGYPPELLDLDLDLEADLGVDTVKQAEIFAAVRDQFGVERDDSLQLREFPTLAHVIGWIREKTGQTTPATAAPEPAADRRWHWNSRFPSRSRSRRRRLRRRRLRRRRLRRRRGRRRMRWPRRWCRWSRRRPATRRSCWIWTWTWRPTSGSTRSSRRRSSPPCATSSASSGMTVSSCGSSRPWRT